MKIHQEQITYFRSRCVGAVAAGLLVILCVWTGALRAEVRGITANPGEDCSTQVNIGWHAELAETSCSVVYTTKADSSWTKSRAISGQARREDAFNGILSKTPDNKDWNEEASLLDYGVALTGLNPDTDYMYKITSGEGANTTQTTVKYFKTAGAGEFSFAWISDVHAYTPIPSRLNNLNRIFNAATKIDPSMDFVFSTGDVVAWGGSYSFWKKLFEQPYVSNYLFVDVIGNHDWMIRGKGGSSEFFRIAHNKPANGYAGQEGICYWFLYGDVLFLTFNNEVMKTSDEAEAKAKAWAADVIKQQKGRYRRIVIAQHYQWFDGRNGRTSWYANWKAFRFSGTGYVFLCSQATSNISGVRSSRDFRFLPGLRLYRRRSRRSSKSSIKALLPLGRPVDVFRRRASISC